MTPSSRFLAAIAFLAAAISIDAQQNPLLPTERVLLPVVILNEAPGAFGSRWVTELVGRNSHSAYVKVSTEVPTRPCVITCRQWPAQPGETFTLRVPPLVEGTGLFLYIYGPPERIALNLRVQDLSRQALTWGTELPVVRAKDTFTGALDLLNIPLDERFRQTIRIYDFDARGDARVAVRVYRDGENVPAAETTIALAALPFAARDESHPQAPGYAQLGDLTRAFPALVGASRARVEIAPLTEGLRFWAFGSVTNNETQHVTTITPR